MTVRRWHIILALLAIGAVACSTTRPSSSPAWKPDTAAPTADAGAQLACPHFRNVAADARDGLLTTNELRTKLQEVERDARISEVPGLASAARRMVAAITSGTSEELAAAVEDMDQRCRSVGQ